MVSTYHGIETGRSAVGYFRKGLEVSSLNMSRKLDEGYSRQVVGAETAGAYTGGDINGYLGAGANIAKIQRMRDTFIDQQYRNATTTQAYWSTVVKSLGEIERFITDPKQKNLNNRLDDFWAGMQAIHTRPDDKSVRADMIERTYSVTSFAKQLKTTFDNHRDSLNKTIYMKVQETNTIIDQIGVLNGAINAVRLAGGEPNELLDKRDLLADKLVVLTGAHINQDGVDDLDGDYKVILNGKTLVQGTETRHLVCVPNPGNSGYYDIQIEDNLYDVSSDPSVAEALIERRADDQRPVDGSCNLGGTHELDVKRTADEFFWSVGYGKGVSQGGSRLDGLLSAQQKLGISGSFALQVGSGGVRNVSRAFASNPPGMDVVLGPPGPGAETEYRFRVAAGDFESTISLAWNAGTSQWEASDNLGNGPTAGTGAGGAFTNQDLSEFLNQYSGEGITARVDNHGLVVETTDRQYVSFSDLKGDLIQKADMQNPNPAVLIEVSDEDSLQTIANKINNAYRFNELGSELKGTVPNYTTNPPDTAPNTPESWMHATVEKDANGEYYLRLTSNVAGEEARINVLSGAVCGSGAGEMHVPRLLGLLENSATGQADVTSYTQVNPETGAITTRDTGDVFVDDAWFTFDGREYLSFANSFKDANRVQMVGKSPLDATDFHLGIRLTLKGEGTSTITVRHPVTNGELFAMVKSRDDLTLGQMDFFDDMMYKYGTEFNAIHYAGYGVGDYAETTGMSFFKPVATKHGSLGVLEMDELLVKDASRIAAASGDGTGKSRGLSDGNNALLTAQLQKRKLFSGGMADFNTFYESYVADLGAFADRAYQMEKTQNHVVEQIDLDRKSVMDVDPDEEMLSAVAWNQQFNAASQYISKLFAVIDQIISGVGRVGL